MSRAFLVLVLLAAGGSAACDDAADGAGATPPVAVGLEGAPRPTTAPGAGWDTLWTALAQTPLGPDDWLRMGPFPPAVAAWDSAVIDATGYMVPLDPSPAPERFLLVGAPLADCAFCIPGGSAGVIDVVAPGGVRLTYEPVTLRGRFHTLEGDPDGALFRLTDAAAR